MAIVPLAKPGAHSTLPTRPVGGRIAPAPPAQPTRPRGTAPRTPSETGTAVPAWRGRALAGGLLVVGLLVIAVVVFNPFAAPVPAAGSGLPMGQVLEFADQGHTHIPVAAPHPTYNSNPATSGWHREEFPPDFPHQLLYATPLPDEVTVHVMEHGNLIAWYHCLGAAGATCATVQDQLLQVARAVPPGAAYRLLVTPRDDLPDGVEVALGAWQHLEYLPAFDARQVADFIHHFGSGAP